MPVFREYEAQLAALKIAAVLMPKLRPEVRALEKQLRALTDSVDGFHRVLDGRDWVFTEQLNIEEMRPAIEAGDVAALEAVLIDHYSDAAKLQRLLWRLKPLPNMAERIHLVEYARDDHLAGRYYATTLTLLAVMDGFVNEIEKARRGLSSRDPVEINAWNSVVGHHLGLKAAHRTFTKTIKATSTEEVTTLHRNGIVHGTLPNFNNVVVASKAWNRLMAVVDWARAIETAKQPPEAPTPPIRESFAKMRATLTRTERLKTWTGRAVTLEADGATALTAEPVGQAATKLFDAWTRRNYGVMAPLFREAPKRAELQRFTGEIRRRFENSELSDWHLDTVELIASSSAIVTTSLTLDGETFMCETRWSREDGDRKSVPEFEQGGEWRTIHYWPDEFAPRHDS
jgi:hypothetical protein